MLRARSNSSASPNAALHVNNHRIVDATSFLWTLPDIFERGMLAFQASSSTPTIIDGSANIGLATLFFKRLYPAEPHHRLRAGSVRADDRVASGYLLEDPIAGVR